jgi:L-rhamnose-H+ transport protein
MDEFLEGIALILVAAFFQGTFAMFLKFTRRWKWENFWAIFSLVSLVISPIVYSYLLVPNTATILSLSPANAIFNSLFFGILWGIGSVLFGLSIVRIGIALTYSLIIGLTAAIGSLLPMLLTSLPTLNVLLPFSLGILIMFLGLTFSAYAGMKRETQQRSKQFKLGLIIAAISGLTSPMLNIGFVVGSPILETALTLGVSAEFATIPRWIVVLLGGFLVNFSYAVYLLFKAKTYKLFSENTSTHLIFSVTSGVFFFSGLVIYGIASSLLNTLGTSIGWALLMSLMILISNLTSILTGEWKNSKKALRYQLISISILILGMLIMGLSFYI